MMTGFDFGLLGGGWAMAAFLIVPALAVVWLVVAAFRSDPHSSTSDSTALLKERFARGEIDSTEYEQARHLLNK